MNWTGVLENAVASIATGGLTLLTTYSQTNNWRTAGIAGGAALCAFVLSRLGVQGAVTSYRGTQVGK
jgi:hypothetical protein